MISKANLSKGRRLDRRYRDTSRSKLERPGLCTGIIDRFGNELLTGDRILSIADGLDGRLLYSRHAKQFRFCYSYSMWYGDDPYDADSYGKSFNIPTDNGMKMHIEKL